MVYFQNDSIDNAIEILNTEFDKVALWFDSNKLTLNINKTLPITIAGTLKKEFDDLDILGVTFDSKQTFEKHICSVSIATSQRLCVFHKSW